MFRQVKKDTARTERDNLLVVSVNLLTGVAFRVFLVFLFPSLAVQEEKIKQLRTKI